jgi:hypothetical protein
MPICHTADPFPHALAVVNHDPQEIAARQNPVDVRLTNDARRRPRFGCFYTDGATAIFSSGR